MFSRVMYYRKNWVRGLRTLPDSNRLVGATARLVGLTLHGCDTSSSPGRFNPSEDLHSYGPSVVATAPGLASQFGRVGLDAGHRPVGEAGDARRLHELRTRLFPRTSSPVRI